MNTTFTVYVDFDSTLYNTSLFSNDLRAAIADMAHTSINKVRDDGQEFVFHPFLGGYDYEKHIRKYDLDANELWKVLDTIANQKNYLYPDSIEFMQSLQQNGLMPKILTFGEPRFQMAKIKPVLSLLSLPDTGQHIEVIVVNKKKNQHITTSHEGEIGVLVDDKPEQELPDGFTEIYLDRAKKLTKPSYENNVVTVSNLCQAKDVIDALRSN